jgi:Domain of unknown function (DUF4281)
MTPDTIFSLCNSIALAGWLILIFLPFWSNRDKFIVGIIVTLFGIIYSWLIFSSFDPSVFQSFSTLDGVMGLFTNKTMVTAGWVHYLAFDLMAGIFISRNARLHGINHWLTVPCLFFTFMLGPFGLLLYLLLRLAVTRTYFAENYNH